MTSKQRARLRAVAQKTEPVLQIGKQGVTPEAAMNLEQALEAREIVKISVLSNCEAEPCEVAKTLAGRTRSECVQVIGRKIVLYRESKTKKDKLKFAAERGK
ncbi:MAG: ribosome assembly RNA-binding protein YhbY [Defluviitaleaceae bacterium]|nr:ribosome assembly RNA-binding protein YhbY [Defluviitaleaceae bacterium]